MIAIELNERVIAIARNEDVVECHDEDTADTLRAKGYVYLGDAWRPATEAEQALWAARAC
jgi:hypothetical protein